MKKIFTLIALVALIGVKGLGQVTQTFNYNGLNQTFTVPAGVTSIDVKIWGAGGGGSVGGPSSGGSGAFVKGTATVTAGQSLVVVVGGGGVYAATTGGFGGGGASGKASTGASGGGYSGIFLTSVAQGNAITVAGGGGGGGYFSAVTYGGGGGATSGTSGGDRTAGTFQGGRGATVAAGGAGGAGTTPGSAGSALIGGAGGVTTSYGGGGGGGGYFGGGGGYGSTTTNYSSGGGGGSSFLGSLTTFTNTAGTTSTSSGGTQAPGSGETGYVAGVGNGGSSSSAPGGNGLVTITYTPPCTTPAVATALNLTPVAGGASITGAFTAPGTAPTGYLVIRTTTSTAPTTPVLGTIYTPGTNALGGYIVSTNTTTGFTDNGLTPSTQYWYWIYSYNSGCIGTNPVYSATSLNGNTTTTACTVATNTMALTASGTYDWNTAANWSLGHVPYTCENAVITGSSTLNATATVNLSSNVIVNSLSITLTGASTTNGNTDILVFNTNAFALTLAGDFSLANNSTGGSSNATPIPAQLETNIASGGSITCNNFNATCNGTGSATVQHILDLNVLGGLQINGATLVKAPEASGLGAQIQINVDNNPASITFGGNAVLDDGTTSSVSSVYVGTTAATGNTTGKMIFKANATFGVKAFSILANIHGLTVFDAPVSQTVTVNNATTMYFPSVQIGGTSSPTVALAGTANPIISASSTAPISLTVNNSSTLDLNTHTFNLSSAATSTFSVASGAALKLSGASGGQTGSNFPLNYSTYTLAGSTTEYYGATQTVYSGASYGNLSLSTSGIKSATSGLTVASNLLINSPATFSGGNALTHNITGNWTNNGTFTVGTSTINLNGTAQTISGSTTPSTFYNLTLAAGGTKMLNVATTISATEIINSGVIENLGTFSSTANALTLNGVAQSAGTYGGTGSAATYVLPTYFAANTGILTVSTSSCTPGNWIGNVSTDWFNAGNWCGNIVPTATTNVVIPSGAPFQPTIGVTAGTAVCNNLTINASATLTINGSNSLAVSGNWTNNGSFVPNTSTVTFSASTGTQTLISGGIATANQFYSISHTGAGILQLSTNALAVTGAFTNSAGIYNANGFATSITGLTTVSAGTYTAGSAVQNLTGGLTVAGGTFTGSTGAVNTGTVTLNSGTLTAPSTTLSITGNWVYSGGIFAANGGIVNFSGTAQSITGSTTTFNNLTFSGSNTKTFGVATTIAGTLTIGSGIVADLGTFASSAAALTLNATAQPAGTYGGTGASVNYVNTTYFAANSGILTVGTCTPGNWLGGTSTDWFTASNWCGSTVPTATTNVVILSTTVNQPIIGSAGAACNNLTINSGAILTITGTNGLAVSGIWTNAGTFTPNSSTVDFNGTGTQTVNNLTQAFFNITHSGSGTLQLLTNNLLASNSFNNSGGGIVNLFGKNLTVGDLTGSGIVTSTVTGALTVTINGTTSPAAFSGIIQEGTATTVSVTKSGTGTLTLSGANTYKGATTISAGTLSANTLANAGTASSIGSGSTTPAISIGSAGVLQYTGAGSSSSRAITLTGTGATIDAGTGTLTLSGNVTGATFGLVLTGTGSATESGIIGTTSGAVTKNGTGTWVLSGTSTYTGSTTLNAGVVSVSADNNLGSSSNTLIFNNGTTLRVTASTSMSRAVTLNTGGGTLDLAFPLTFTGAISGAGGLVTGGNDLLLQRTIASGNNNIGTLTITSGRTFVFFGLNNINGSVVNVASGATLDFSTTAATTVTNTLNFASGSVLANRGGVITVGTASFPGTGTMIFNSDDQVTTGIVVTANYPLTGNLAVQVGGNNTTVGTVTLSGIISGAATAGLTKTLNGTLILSGANTYTGLTTISAGTVNLNSTSGSDNAIVGDILINGGTLGYVAGYEQINDNSTVTLSSGTFNVADHSEIIGALIMTGGTLNKTGSSVTTQTLQVKNPSSITGGTLNFTTSSASLNVADALSIGGTNFIYSNGATAGTNTIVLSNAANTTITYVSANTAPAIFSNGGTGVGEFQIENGATTTFNIASASVQPEVQIAWNLTQGASTSALTKTGTGILAASGTVTYAGATTISAGEFRLNPAANLSLSTQVILNGGTFGTTNITSGRTITSSSTLQLAASSSINLGSNAHTITFANSSAVTWAGTTLTINGWTGTAGASGTAGKIFVGVGGLSSAQLAKITFTGYSGIPIILASGELVPAGPILTVTGTTGFGTLCIGGTTSPITYTITNTGAAASGITVTSNNTQFVVSGLSSTTIPNNGTATFQVTFAPNATGAQNATITVASTTANSNSTTIGLTGTGAAQPVVTAPSPASQTVCISGTIAPITVTASGGTGTFSFQWFSNITNSTTGGTSLGSANGAQTATYTPPATATTGTTYYYVTVSQTGTGCGPVTSSTASVTVTAQPTVNALIPANQIVCTGGTPISYSASASGGAGTFSYQWYSNTINSNTGGTSITGATFSSYTPSTATAGILYYYVTVSQTGSGCGPVSSSTAKITVLAQPTVTAPTPATQTVCTGGTPASLSATASGGTGTFTYQWFSNTTNSTTGGTNLGSANGAQTSSYTPSSAIAGTLYYYVRVSQTGSGCGPVTSATATVVVLSQPTVTAPTPSTQTVCTGGTLTSLTVSASGGTGTFSYQWYSNTTNSNTGGTPISGETTATYAPSSATAGTLYYYVVVGQAGSGCGPVTSTTATVIVLSQPTVTAPTPATQTVCTGSTPASLTVTASGGTGAFSYQWYSNTTNSNTTGTAVSGETTNTYAPSGATAGTMYYYVVVSQSGAGCGPVASATATVTVNPLPTATISASASSVCQNTTAPSITFTGTTGTAPFIFTYTIDGGSPQTVTSDGSGVATVTVPTNTAGTTTYTLTNVSDVNCSQPQSGSATIMINPDTWKGVDNDWNQAYNWTCGVPTTNSDVYIPDPLTTTGHVNPSIFSGTIPGAATAHNITIASGATLTVTSNLLRVSGTISNSGTFDLTSGTIEFNGTSAQTITANTFYINTIRSLIISNNVTIATGALVSVTGDLTFGTGITNATLTTNDNLTLKSSEARTASVGMIDAANHITGKVTVERYIATGTGASPDHPKTWQLLAVPTSGTGANLVTGDQSINAAWMEGAGASNVGATNAVSAGNPVPGYGTMITSNVAGATTFPSPGFDAYTAPGPTVKVYNYLTNGYDGPASTTVPVYNQKGYFVFVRGDRSVYTSTGPANPTILRTKGLLFSPDNLPPVSTVHATKFESVGNPYASPVDLRSISHSGSTTEFYIVWDPRLGGSYNLGAFQTLGHYGPSGDNNYYALPGGGSYPVYDPNNLVSSNYLQSGQAFFIQTPAMATTDGTVSFAESNKATLSGSETIFSRVLSGNKSSMLRTTLNNVNSDGSTGTIVDGVMNEFGDGYTSNVNGRDARKLVNTGENLSIRNNGTLLSTERRHTVVGSDTIFLNLTSERVQQYQFNFSASNLTSVDSAVLIDNYLQTRRQLSLKGNTAVNFNVVNVAGSYAPDRFMIVFKALAVLPTAITTITATQQGTGVDVQWSVSNEHNIQQYIVERSTDSVNFTTLTTTRPTGNNGTNPTYVITDAKPVSGNNYYRVQMADNRGNVSYSTIVKVTLGIIKNNIQVYPNPVTDGKIHLQFSNEAAGKFGIRLLDKSGQVIVEKEVTRQQGNSTELLQWNYNIAHGIYKVEITRPDGSVKNINVLY